MTRAAFIGRETAISVAINASISAGICWLAFGGLPTVAVWSVPGLVLDMLPQGFMVGLMATLVPAVLARRAILAGVVPARPAVPLSSAALVRRALGAALLSALAAVAIAAAALAVAHIDRLPLATVFLLKIAAGAILALAATAVTLDAMLARTGDRMCPTA